MDGSQPLFLVMAGPNGAGKTTCAGHYLPVEVPYLNADEIARTLRSEQTQATDAQAARIVLKRMDEAEARRQHFAVETTLASRTLAGRANRLRSLGYFFHLVYIWTPSPDFSIARVRQRVRTGGHDIPEETIRRRWRAGLKLFFSLYQPIADQWDVVNNFADGSPVSIATGQHAGPVEIFDQDVWNYLERRASDAT